ncbi:MAG: hypothetical protein GY807_12320, partial [Gammaproteobacteria bacterium]|nr:hypothetical protein [Gammaproteobacteria bacterium]
MNTVAYKSVYWYEISSKTMSILTRFIILFLTACVLLFGLNLSQAESDTGKRRIFIVSSYNRDYLWSQSTHAGVTAAMLRYGYIDNETQLQTFTDSDYLESSRAVVKKTWMDTKRHSSVTDIAAATLRIMNEIEQFQPDLVLLGDDNATNYIGNQLLDTETPVVFWGINSLPLKYGLVDSMDRPGHNITGVWQSGFYKESLDLLHTLAPKARTFAILACNSATAKPKVKQIAALGRQGELPLKLIATVQTNSYEEFQYRVLA